MEISLEQLNAKLPNSTGEERVDLLLDISRVMRKNFDPQAMNHIDQGLELAETLHSYKKKALLYQEKFYVYQVAQKTEQGIDAAKSMLELCEKIGDKELSISAMKNIGAAYEVDLDNKSYWYEKALKEGEQINNIKEIIWLHGALGAVKDMQMLFDESTTHCLKAIDLAQELQDEELLGFSYYNLGAVTKDERSIEYFKKTVELFEITNSVYYWQSCVHLGWVYKEYGYFDEAHRTVDKSIKIAEETKAKARLVLAYHRKADLLIAQATQKEEVINKRLINEAKIFVNKAIGFIEQGDANRTIVLVFIQKVEIEYHLGNYKEALESLNSNFQESQLIPIIDVHRLYKELRWKVYDALNDTENAYRSYKEFVALDNNYKYSKSLKESKSLEAKFAAKEKGAEVKRLHELEELKTRFFSQVTHELRTPLSLILGPIRQIYQTDDKQEINQLARIVDRNANRLLQLVNQLLDVNKLEAGKMHLQKSYGNFSAFIETLVQAFQILAAEKQIQLDFINDLDELIVNFDSDKMEKIGYNLLSNAFKFTPSGGQIVCHLTALPSENLEQIWIDFSLSDTGRGISEDNLQHVFDRFYQADNSQTREVEGTGIGLALVKELVELMDGKIEVNSKVGEGTTFKFQLPLEIGAKEFVQEETYDPTLSFYELKTALNQTENKINKGKNAPVLLLIEDNQDMHTYIRNVLEDEYILLEAIDGQQGVDLAIERIPDIILSDVMMPKKDGYQVCKELKEDDRTSHIPIVLLTAKTALKSRLEGLEQGADVYLSKPFSMEELKFQLNNLLTTQSNFQKKYNQLDVHEIPEQSLTKEELFLKKIRDIVEENIEDRSLNVEKLSQFMLMSSSQLYRKVNALTNLSTSQFIRDVRLIKGKKLLEENKGNISEVAYQVGLTPEYFSKSFIKKYGVFPKTLLK